VHVWINSIGPIVGFHRHGSEISGRITDFRIKYQPIPVAERSKAWDCSRSPARIAGSNLAGGRDVSLL
jgi:hypothetical protein